MVKRPSKRSLAAKKAWKVRQAKAAARSAAAKKGWATRRQAAKARQKAPEPGAMFVPLTPREAKERSKQKELALEEIDRLRDKTRLRTEIEPERRSRYDGAPDRASRDDDDFDMTPAGDNGLGDIDYDFGEFNDQFFEQLEEDFEEFEFEKLS